MRSLCLLMDCFGTYYNGVQICCAYKPFYCNPMDKGKEVVATHYSHVGNDQPYGIALIRFDMPCHNREGSILLRKVRFQPYLPIPDDLHNRLSAMHGWIFPRYQRARRLEPWKTLSKTPTVRPWRCCRTRPQHIGRMPPHRHTDTKAFLSWLIPFCLSGDLK